MSNSRNGDYETWKVFDFLLCHALYILSDHQQFPKDMSLYSGLHNVHMTSESIAQLQTESAHFATFVSTTPDLSVAQMFKGEQGMIIEFDTSVVTHGCISKA